MAELAPTLAIPRKGWIERFSRSRQTRRPGAVTALDVDREVVRVVQIVPRGNRMVATEVAVARLQFAADVDRLDPAVVGAAVGQALQTLRIKPSQVVMGVPRHSVVLRTLLLPATQDVRELASMVHMQIGKDLPFRQEEAVIDFKVCDRTSGATKGGGGNGSGAAASADAANPGAKVEVLVATVRREAVEYYKKVADGAKLKLIALGWLSEANARSVQACAADKSAETVALISLRPDEVSIDIVARGSLLFSRGAKTKPDAPPPTLVETGAEPDDSEPSEPLSETAFVDAVVIEVVRSLHSYGGMDFQGPVQQVLVVGATGQEEAVAGTLQNRLNIPCRRLDPAGALDLPTAAQQGAGDAVGALGLGLGVNDPAGLPFDFLNPKRPAVQRNMRRIRMIALGAAGAVLLISFLGFRAHLINLRLKGQRELQAELTKAEKNLPIYRKMQVQAATLQNWTKEGRNWLEQYAYLSAVLPACEDLYLTSLSVSAQGNIHMAVQARSGEILANLDKQLRAAGYEVKPLAITPGNEKYGYNFRSTVELVGPAKKKIELSKVQPLARPEDDASLEAKARSGRKGGRS